MSEKYGLCRACKGEGQRSDEEECLSCSGTGFSGNAMDYLQSQMDEDWEKDFLNTREKEEK